MSFGISVYQKIAFGSKLFTKKFKSDAKLIFLQENAQASLQLLMRDSLEINKYIYIYYLYMPCLLNVVIYIREENTF